METSHPIKRIFAAGIDIALLEYAIRPLVGLLIRPYFPPEPWTGETTDLINAHSFCMVTLYALYFVLMEWAPWGGTFGKLAIGIRVVDEHGERLSFLRTVGRNFAKLLMFPTMGTEFLFSFFTRSRQALHDIFSGTHIITERPMF
jgi:uncharacterized RDD family membrane protein YckC